jgi:hypothetical protein
LLKQNGYNAVFDEEIPNDAKRCDMLWLDATGSSGIIYTKVRFLMKDCNGFIVFKSIEGKSKEKEYAKAYREAVNMAFTSIEMKSMEENENASDVAAASAVIAASVLKSDPAATEVNDMTTANETTEVAKIESTQYFFENYQLVFSEKEIEVHFKGDKIGKMIPLKGAEGYLVETSQFSGYGYKKDDVVIVERVVEGISDPVIMSFQKVND